jgi:hypothetical protein
MRIAFLLGVVIACGIGGVPSTAADAASVPAAAAPAMSVATVSWLAGCWSLQSGDNVVEEQWLPPRANSMLAMGRTVRAGKLVEYELLLLSERAGQLVYRAHPSGQLAAEFMAVAATADRVVFENPQHDFPQQVGYQRQGSDGLLAWVQGTIKGAVRRSEFSYRRVPCGGSNF